MADFRAELHVFGPLLPPGKYHSGVVGAVVAGEGCETQGERPGLFLPFGFPGRSFLAVVPVDVLPYGAVHVELVHRSGDGEEPPVAGDYGSAVGLKGAAQRPGLEGSFELLVGLPNPLDVTDAAYQEDGGGKEKKVQAGEDHYDRVGLLFLCIFPSFCHFQILYSCFSVTSCPVRVTFSLWSLRAAGGYLPASLFHGGGS